MLFDRRLRYRAPFAWLLVALLPLAVRCKSNEQFILERFYAISGGDNWKNNTGWTKNSSIPLCSWYGVECLNNATNQDHGVRSISLSDNNLVGRFARLIYTTLSQLRSVDLSKNPGIHDGGFDGFDSAHPQKNLLSLNFAECSLTSTAGLENAPSSLKELHLTGNQLKGTFPTEIFALTSLQILYLSFNEIRGILPTKIGLLSNLREFYMYQNKLTGQIPTELGLLNKLQVFTLAENILSGTLPTELNKMVNLKTLSFHNKNDNAGSLGGKLPDFAHLPFLSELYLDGNDLSGVIPSTFLKYNNNTHAQVTVGLSGNQLTGDLPLVLSQFQSLTIDLVGNSISLIPISFCDKKGWMGGLVELYGCNAILCEVNYYNDYGRQISAETPCISCDAPTTDYWGATSCGATSSHTASPVSTLDTVAILATFYQKLDGGQWYNRSGWSQLDALLTQVQLASLSTNVTEASLCSWQGILCNNKNQIIEITLQENGLGGTIPTEIAAVSTLQKLDLSGNQAVTIDKVAFWEAIAASPNLTTLDFGDTNVNNLEGIGAAIQLQELTLDGVYISSTIPLDLFQLTNLKSLHMQYNVLTGTLPTQIGNLTNLTVLNLYDNELGGSLPSELGLLSQIDILDLSENRFNGTIPDHFQRLVTLSQLHLHQTFGFLSGTLPAFETFPYLSQLTLDSNKLTGTIPKTFLQGVANKTQEMYVGLSFNNLSGTVPSDLGNFSDMDLLIEGNSFTDIADELCNKTLWMEGEVGKVKNCSAIGCPVGTWNIYGKFSAYINAPCDPCPGNLHVGQTFCKTRNATANQIVEMDELKILNLLYDMTNGPNWTLANNTWGIVGFPLCQRNGVSCEDPQSNSGVNGLSLIGYGLRGKVPSDVFSLPKLRRLELNNNSIEVDFRGIGNATSLQVLHLNSAQLAKLDGLGDASPSLSELRLAFNEMTGPFPPEILKLKYLKTLYLHQNQFTGDIPPDIEQLENLQGIWLDGNMLSGQLPSEMGNMKLLQTISMGNNYFSGTIPAEFNNITGLVQLDLHNQLGVHKLLGTLPAFANFPKLTILKLGNNTFTGTIPANFLAEAVKSAPITVDLSQNAISGAIPSALGTFQELYIDLAGNEITGLLTFCNDSKWVNNSKWMNGMVGQLHSCDAILCPPGTYSTSGRKTSSGPSGGSCQVCETNNIARAYYGQTKCVTHDETFEREILELFFIGFNGSNWIEQTNWVSDKSVCTWFGVGCDGQGSIVSIVLDTNNLENAPGNTRGFFRDAASRVLMLPNLQVLDLRGNDVDLDLMFIESNSSNLQNLTLSSTSIVSLKGIGGAQKLRELHVTDNGLQGTVPDELFTLTNLQRLYMSFNEFIGTLSGKMLANLTNLEEFYMFGNNITGAIPTEVGKLQALKEFVMASNSLNGSIPTEFSSLPALEQLSLYDQQGSTVLTSRIPTFANSPRLWYFDASDNALTGSIPDSFLVHSTFRNSSVSIYLSNNDITGALPLSLNQLSVLDIRLEGNRIASIPQQLCTMSRWVLGNVGKFGNCDAILCHQGSYNSLGRQDSANNTCLPCQSGSPYLGQTSCIDLHSERAILINFFDSTGGSTWTRQSNWKSPNPVCSWVGVLCKDGHTADDSGVTGLFLAENNLQGTLPSGIWALPLLQSINLQGNQLLRVTMEGFSSAVNLEELVLNSVKLDTIAGVSAAKKLKELHITDTALTGTFPEEIFDLGNLEGLYIAFNAFYGTLSTKIGQLTNLRELFAFDNDFSGSIPSEIGSMTSLVDVVLAENLLSGNLPVELSSLPNIQVISLYRRAKPGPKLSGNLTDFDNVPQLTDLFLDHNEIQGTIPRDFLSSSLSAKNIILSFNRLSGTIPLQIGFFPALDLELEGNEISGFDPSFCEKNDWMNGQVANFQCDAILCPNKYAAILYGRATSDVKNFTGNVTCLKCGSDEDAPFYGSTVCRIPVDVKSVLTGLYNTCNGNNWIRQDYWNSNVDICNWDGIGCSRGQVISINLSANNLTGTIPDTLFDISSLQYLWLHSNPISFKFPGEPLTTNLLELRLDNTGLASVKGVSILTSLVTLHLEHNLIQGPFKYDLLQLSNLRALYMGDNGITGTFPSGVEQLSYLNTLSLRSNGMEGGLPSFQNARVLTRLDLSRNSFTGTIPNLFFDGISSLAPLEVDLSGNTLTGQIPSSLGRFQNLTIYLRDNLLNSIPSQLCSNVKWNGGDVARFGCDAILCPPKTYSPLGRAHDKTRCVDCSPVSSFGQSTCASAAPAGLRVQRWALGWSLVLVAAAVMRW